MHSKLPDPNNSTHKTRPQDINSDPPIDEILLQKLNIHTQNIIPLKITLLLLLEKCRIDISFKMTHISWRTIIDIHWIRQYQNNIVNVSLVCCHYLYMLFSHRCLHQAVDEGKRSLVYVIARRMANLNKLDSKDADGRVMLWHTASSYTVYKTHILSCLTYTQRWVE